MSDTICTGKLPYTWRDTIFGAGTVSGDYVFNRQTAEGCDSIVTLHLTVNQKYVMNTYDTICGSALPYTWRDTTFGVGTVSRDYVFNRKTAEGCDSTVILHLTVNNITVSVINKTKETCGNDGSVTVHATGKAPHEYSLDGGSFQTSPSFTGLGGGNHYVVALDANNCIDTVHFDITPAIKPTLSITCPPEIRDTLAFGDCAMKITKALGTPTATHSLSWTYAITNDAPADSIYYEGDNIVTWIMTDDTCGFADTCYQHVYIVFPKCPDAVDCESNVYRGVRIGCDCWTERNLESTKYSDCTDIPCIYEYTSYEHPNTTENVDRYGRLYCFEAAVRDSADNGHGHIQGICPAGWYLPTPEKYEELNTYGADALKSPLYWIPSGGNNSTGFSALPAGFYNGATNRFESMLGETYFWSTSNTGGSTSSSASSMFLNCEYNVQAHNSYGNGYSVRCIKEKE